MSSVRYNGQAPVPDGDPATQLEVDPPSRSDVGLRSGNRGAWTSLKTTLFAGDLFAGEQYEIDFR